jgi:hypothetical protein
MDWRMKTWVIYYTEYNVWLSFHLSIHFLIRPETGTNWIWLRSCVPEETTLRIAARYYPWGWGCVHRRDGGSRRSGGAVAVAWRSPPSVKSSGCADEPEIGSGHRRRRFIECINIPELPFSRRRRSDCSSVWGRKRNKGSIDLGLTTSGEMEGGWEGTRQGLPCELHLVILFSNSETSTSPMQLHQNMLRVYTDWERE